MFEPNKHSEVRKRRFPSRSRGASKTEPDFKPRKRKIRRAYFEEGKFFAEINLLKRRLLKEIRVIIARL
jgi:hypothetical protein